MRGRPAGATKRIESPADGKDVWPTRTVRDADGNIVHQETYYSHYARVDGVTLVGHANVPSRTAVDSTALYARNLVNFLTPLWTRPPRR